MSYAVPQPVAAFPVPGRAPVVGAAAFASTLAAQPLAGWLLGSQSVEMGLPRMAAALFVGLLAGAIAWLSAGRARVWAQGVLADEPTLAIAKGRAF